MKRLMRTALCLGLLSAPFMAKADHHGGDSGLAGDMLVRMRVLNVMPVESGTPSLVGGEVKINNESVPEINFSYFFTNNFAAELILATATHKVMAHSTLLESLDLGDVSLLPPTLTFQYHHSFGNFKPYVGAGINYTFFYGADYGAMETMSYDNTFGWALQVGADYQVSDRVYLNFDVKRLGLSTDVSITTYDGTVVTADVDIDPVLIGIGVGYRF